MSTEFWKIEKDLCRCCHSEGSHKNLAEPCLEGGDEIYSEMLHDTLDINISPVSGDLGTVTYTICEVCIMRLQDAWSFKQQVLQCENRFNDLYTKNVIKLEPDCVVVSIKEEADSDNEGFKEEKLDDSDGDFEMSFGDGNNSDSDMDTKPKSKAKPKAKSKTTPKAPPKRKPATKTASKTSTTSEAAEGQAEPKEKKGPSDDFYNFTTIQQGRIMRYRCNQCDKTITSLDGIRKHIRYAHIKEDKCVCDTCKKEFQNQIKLKSHLRMHKLYNCPECSRPFTNAEMKYHRADEHDVPIPTCDICGFRGETELKITRHKKAVHLKQKDVLCPICAKKFADANHLKMHMVRHNPVKRYKCAFCAKAFPRMNSLRDHEKIHTGEKKFVCHRCGMMFIQLSSLNYHTSKNHHPVT